MVLVGNKNIEELVEYADSFLIGLKDLRGEELLKKFNAEVYSILEY